METTPQSQGMNMKTNESVIFVVKLVSRPRLWKMGLSRFTSPLRAHPYWLTGALAAAVVAALLPLLATHSGEQKMEVNASAAPQTVRVIQPQTRNIIRIIGQPSFVEPYERTSIYPKLSGYIKKWYVDIGDTVKKDQVLADLYVPEIEEDCRTKKATVELDREQVELAKKTVIVAQADVKSATARLESAKAILAQYDAQVARWDSEVKRLSHEVKRGVVDPQVLLESENQLKASIAAQDSAKAEIDKADADLDSKTAKLHEDEVAVSVAESNVQVATSDWKRMEAWVGYLKLYAPFDGIIVARNANTGDFVLPATGDPSANTRAPHLSPSGNAAPVYVVDRTDVVRVFVDIPEDDANYVRAGTKAAVLAKAFRDEPIMGMVTRTAWALNTTSRTLRAEIDLPNTASKIPTDLPEATREALASVQLPKTENQLLPGMYAYGKVIIERPNVRALPLSALTYSGDKAYYWSYDNGKAVRTEIQTGVSDNEWIEVTNRGRGPASPALVQQVGFDQLQDPNEKIVPHFDDEIAWVPFDGSEKVILGDLSVLTDGAPVEVAREPETARNQIDAKLNAANVRPGVLACQ